jgi:hypothetical protein
MARMQADGRTSTTRMPPVAAGAKKIAERAYQLRIAGDTEYKLYTTVPSPKRSGEEATMWADGLRAQDGAAVEAKWVNNPGTKSCTSLYTLNNAYRRPDFVYSRVVGEEQLEMLRYASAIDDPRNKIAHVEIDTNDPRSAAYFEMLRWMNGVRGQVRLVP